MRTRQQATTEPTHTGCGRELHAYCIIVFSSFELKLCLFEHDLCNLPRITIRKIKLRGCSHDVCIILVFLKLFPLPTRPPPAHRFPRPDCSGKGPPRCVPILKKNPHTTNRLGKPFWVGKPVHIQPLLWHDSEKAGLNHCFVKVRRTTWITPKVYL